MKILRKSSRQLTDEELRRELSKPLPAEAVKQLREIRESAAWLLTLSLQNMRANEQEGE